MSEKIFACVKCGQVYHDFYPNKCMRYNCISTMFEIIKKEDVINMHDVVDSLFREFLELIIEIANKLLKDLK